MKLQKVLLSTIISCALVAAIAPFATAQQSPQNVALNKKATFNKAPNYRYSAKPGNTEITDGKYAGDSEKKENTSSLWVQKETVGWQNAVPVEITIDLGKEQPISGASFSTAAGRASVGWPSMIYMAVSNDKKNWHFAGDLAELSLKNGVPPKEGYANFRYVTHDLQTKGRYISFGIMSGKYVFTDEIEVYKGDDAWLAKEIPGQKIPSLAKYISQNQEASYARRRLRNDIDAVRGLVQKSSISSALKSTFMARLDKDAAEIEKIKVLPSDFKAILPFNDSHRDTFAVYGELLAAQGQKPLTVWKEHRYAWVPLLATPNDKEKLQLDFSMLRNQARSDSFLLTNASGTEKNITLQFDGAPSGAQSGWLQVDSVEWTDTAQGLPVADALIPVTAQDGKYQIKIPAGMTRKVWITVDSSKVPAGSYKSTFTADGITVPMNLEISSVAMNRPRFSLGMWDYVNGKGNRGINLKNREAALKLMRSHYVDSPWATNAVLPKAEAADFDAQGNLKKDLDFSDLDEWIKLWSGARRYFVYLSKSPTNSAFAGAKMGTKEFDVRVGSWAKAISAHMTDLGLKPSQMAWLIVDESHTDDQDDVIAAWAKAINAAAPEITLFSDTMWARPDKAKNQEAVTQMDILCPKPTTYAAGGEDIKNYYKNLQKQGKNLWFYQCSGPIRPYNPQQYYRYQTWLAFNAGATGQGFWSFGDISGAATSWNEYATTRETYAPVFIDNDTIYNSIHWDAVRDGMQDNEELAMLEDAIKKSNNAGAKIRAQKVLSDAVATVVNDWNPSNYNWQQAENNDLADAQSARVRKELENL